MTTTNIAAYRFVPIATPAAWVVPLRARASDLRLKGTVIVADEGVNLVLAGTAAAIDDYLGWLAREPLFVDRDGQPALRDLAVKRSFSSHPPFRRLRVRHRPEIVTMRTDAVRPVDGRAPVVAPERLAAWLAQGHDDDGRALTLLDTRNAFEYECGSFEGARHLGLARFEAFPEAAKAALVADPSPFADRTVVAFCTGGIRCEKAALVLSAIGVPHVVQLDGGILDYFDKVGGTHWRGDCFVFDARGGLTPALEPVSASISADENPAARRASTLNGPRGSGAP